MNEKMFDREFRIPATHIRWTKYPVLACQSDKTCCICGKKIEKNAYYFNAKKGKYCAHFICGKEGIDQKYSENSEDLGDSCLFIVSETINTIFQAKKFLASLQADLVHAEKRLQKLLEELKDET